MKKVLTLVAVVAFAASFTACKKDRKCICTGTDDWTGEDRTDEFQTGKRSKSDADEYCNSWDGWYSDDSDCELE